MSKSLWAKIFGWALAGLTVGGQLLANGTPHGAAGWLNLVGGLLTGLAVHNAAATDGTK